MIKTSLSLQNSSTTMNVATKLYTYLFDYVNNIRDKFDQYELAAIEKKKQMPKQR